MPEFLILDSPKVALDKWLTLLPANVLECEEIDSELGLNRISAETICSNSPIPEFPRSTVDGYAVRAKDTFGASEGLPAYFSLIGEVPMGNQPAFSISVGKAALIHTGGMLPEGADAVVMLENTQLSKHGDLEVTRSVASFENVIQVGEDITTGQTVIPAGVRLRAADIGGLMALGKTTVLVRRKPVIGILSSGDEVVTPQETPHLGQVRDINSYTLAAHVEEWGGQPKRLGIISDNIDDLREALRSAIDSCDAVLVTAGSSASVRDHTSQVIAEMGEPGVLVHGINIKPGKPTILAICGRKPVVGLPGNPVSALVIARFFVKPMLARMLGYQPFPVEPSISAVLSTNIPSQAGREDWWPVRLVQGSQNVKAEPVFFKSSLIFNYTAADGLIQVPADANGLLAGSRVEVFLL